ncbi:MAG: type II toxin-antitoxin system RelE/ParE family toxin [Chromatiales bacterium]|nr:type II toxin-antitoxin system RelE/ParE family toxin [Chromatiales bacterium]
MPSFRLTAKAKTDLIKIARYTDRVWGHEQRNLYLKELDDAFHLISDNPSIGEDSGFIKKKYRKFPQGSHLIFYKLDSASGILVIRVLHKGMDVVSKFHSP